MIQQQRHARILSFLAENEFMSVEEAVELLNVSPATVRRDFNILAQDNLAERTRGGLRRARSASFSIMPFNLREIRHSNEKESLARKAASLLSPGDVLFVDGGTTTFQLSTCLPNFPLRIITNSLHLAMQMGEKRFGKSGIEIFLSGGYLYPQSGQLIGPQAKFSLSQYHANWAFMSVSGITPDKIYYSNELLVETDQAMMSNADKVVILADHSKINNRAMYHLSAVSDVDFLITDKWPENDPILQQIREAGVEVIVVDA